MRSCPTCTRSCEDDHRFCPICGASLGEPKAARYDDPFLGRTLPGQYEILELVGVGGMGRVYRAEQRTLGRTVAVKVIHPHLVGDEAASARFINEARAASRLNHPNSVAVIDFGRTDDGLLYLVMEFLRGRDLARVIYDEGPLPLRRVIDIVRQALGALGEAHLYGIVHRDLKPENIVLEPVRSGGDFVKVVDFGLAKMREPVPGSRSITSPGTVCGTPDYMAPEQGRGDALDARSDLYAMGVILFQLLTGKLPYVAETPTQIVVLHMSAPVPDPRAAAPAREIPEVLARVVMKALAKKANERFADADQFVDALAAARAELDDAAARAKAGGKSPCATCGVNVPAAQKFCGECGARVVPPDEGASSSWPPKPGEEPGSTPAPRALSSSSARARVPLPLPLLDRDDDLAWLGERRRDATGGLIAARVVGEVGTGKTRLFAEAAATMRATGDVVIETGPDPFGADVGYHALRHAIVAAAELSASGGDVSDWGRASDEACVGLREIFRKADPEDAALAPLDRRKGASAALAWALGRAAARASTGRVVLLVDDYERVDGTSRLAFEDLIESGVTTPTLVVAAHGPRFEPAWHARHAWRAIAPLRLSSIAPITHGLGTFAVRPIDAPSGHIAPLHVEHLLRFSIEGAGASAPTRLGDLVSLRIDRLPADVRRVLQAAAILGDEADPSEIQALVPEEPIRRTTTRSLAAVIGASLDRLEGMGLVSRGPRGVRNAHPLVREIALASIPVGARREMYARAARLAEDGRLALEVRARRNELAGNAAEALLQVDRLVDRALARDDVETALGLLHRGLDLARRHGFRGEIEDPLRTVMLFSTRLGETLFAADRLGDAEAVLREALDFAGPSDADRARVLGALAKVVRARGRTDEAVAHLGEAVSHAARAGVAELAGSFDEMRRAWAAS